MSTTIVDGVIDCVNNTDLMVLGDLDSLREMEEAASLFNSLIDKGVLKPRGYTLQTIESDCLSPVSFNVSQ